MWVKIELNLEMKKCNCPSKHLKLLCSTDKELEPSSAEAATADNGPDEDLSRKRHEIKAVKSF